MSGKVLLLIAFLLTTTLSYAQQKAFYEVVKDDSVLLYFNRDFSFTDKECFDFIRYTRVTDKGDFNGYFEDRNTEGLLLARGTYANGIKNGYFEFYYLNGILYSAGNYKNNHPAGIWEFFYETGIPERTINVIDSTNILLLKHHDYTGQIKVQDGAGKFQGIVDGKMPTYVIGKVVNGKADGKWIIPGYNGTSIYTERFENGKLIKSSLVSKRKMNNNQTPPKLNKFFIGNYLFLLERYKYQNCSESQQYFVSSSSMDARLFNMHMRSRLNNVIRTNIRLKQNDYTVGDNFMTVQFSVNEKGKPYDIKLLTDWGGQFFESVKNSINRAVFSTKYQTMYFHLKFSYSNRLQYKYSFKFSKRNRKSKSTKPPVQD